MQAMETLRQIYSRLVNWLVSLCSLCTLPVLLSEKYFHKIQLNLVLILNRLSALTLSPGKQTLSVNMWHRNVSRLTTSLTSQYV